MNEPGPAPLAGRVIGILQSRHQEVMADLIRREGAVPLLAPCLKEVPADERTGWGERLEAALAEFLDLAVFQTGVGAELIFDTASRGGLGRRLADRLAAATVLARGPKPASVLRRHGVRVDLRTADPHTTGEVVALLSGLLQAGVPPGYRALVQQYGADNPALVDFLASAGATVLAVAPYRWALPDDVGPVRRLLEALERGEVDCVAFTSAAQVENVYRIAAREGCGELLTGWLRGRTVVAALGPATAGALGEHGVEADVRPARPKMAPFVHALADHFRVGTAATR